MTISYQTHLEATDSGYCSLGNVPHVQLVPICFRIAKDYDKRYKSEIGEAPDLQLVLVGVELIGRSVGQATGAE